MSGQLPPLVVMGVSGCGKSTVGPLLGQRLDKPFFDAAVLHPAANKEKMGAGIPVTDADREPWLGTLGNLLGGKDDGGRTVPPNVACSALKRRYKGRVALHKAAGLLPLRCAGCRKGALHSLSRPSTSVLDLPAGLLRAA